MRSLEQQEMVRLPAPPRKSRGRGRIRVGMAVRIACVAVAVGALAVLGWRLGVGIGRVSRGEMTGAQMWSELGAWLLGSASNDEAQGEPQDGSVRPPVDGTPDNAVPPVDEGMGEVPDGQDLYSFDRSLVPDGARAVVPTDLFDGSAYDPNALTWQAPPTDAAQGPLVLIVHSHGSEGYTPQGTVYLEADAVVGRSDDAAGSVVGVGKELSDALNEHGIGAIHCSTRFDQAGNAGAFERAAEAVAAYLEQYPTVRYVIDIHRGAGLADNGDVLRAVAWHEGEAVAQTAWIVPTGGMSEALAAALCERMNTSDTHPCCSVRAEHFGRAWEMEGVYILRAEVGMAGNSQEEAARAAEHIAHALSALLQ